MSARALAPLALIAGFLLASVAIAGAGGPVLLAALHRAGYAGATLEDVCLRLLEVVAIALTFPLLAALGGGGLAAWGLAPSRSAWPRFWRRVVRGVLIGIATLAPVCAALFALDVRVMRVDLPTGFAPWAAILAGVAMSAAAVALSEELWHRGGLFTALQRAGGPALALCAVSVLYAATHFLDAPDDTTAAGPLGGFHVLGQALAAVPRLENLDSFVALLCAGAALGLARLRDGDAALAIGIHAGWVLSIKVFKKLTYVSDATPMRALAGTYDDVIGWLAALVLAALALALWRWPREAQ